MQRFNSVDDLSSEKDGSVTRGSSGTQKLLNQTSLKVVLGNAISLRRAYDFKTENPLFIVSMKPSETQSSLVTLHY